MIQQLRSPATARLAANVATVGFGLAAVLQLLLALGLLPVTMAWGGSQTLLTLPLRLASVVAAALLGVFAYGIRRRAGLAGDGRPSTLTKVLAWAIALYMALNTFGNFASSSPGEALLFGPLSLLLALSCLLVAASRMK